MVLKNRLERIKKFCKFVNRYNQVFLLSITLLLGLITICQTSLVNKQESTLKNYEKRLLSFSVSEKIFNNANNLVIKKKRIALSFLLGHYLILKDEGKTEDRSNSKKGYKSLIKELNLEKIKDNLDSLKIENLIVKLYNIHKTLDSDGILISSNISAEELNAFCMGVSIAVFSLGNEKLYGIGCYNDESLNDIIDFLQESGKIYSIDIEIPYMDKSSDLKKVAEKYLDKLISKFSNDYLLSDTYSWTIIQDNYLRAISR